MNAGIEQMLEAYDIRDLRKISITLLLREHMAPEKVVSLKPS